MFMFCVVCVRILTWTRTPGIIWRNCVAVWPSVILTSTSALDHSTCPGNLSASSSVMCGRWATGWHQWMTSAVCVFQARSWWETLRAIPGFRTKPRCCANTFLQGESACLLTMIMLSWQLRIHLSCVSQVLILEEADGRGVELRSYVLPNEPIDDKVPLERFLVPIETIERASGLLFVPNIMKRTSSLQAITNR